MKNLEEQCLEKLNKLLSKFDLEIEIVHITSCNFLQYRLINNSISKNSYYYLLWSWSSISDILMHSKHNNSIFDCLNLYSASEFNSYTFQRYSEAYNAIKHFENICCLEEFIVKYDLMGI